MINVYNYPSTQGWYLTKVLMYTDTKNCVFDKYHFISVQHAGLIPDYSAK